MENQAGEKFLLERYPNLDKSQEVRNAIKRHKQGLLSPHSISPETKIQIYLDRLRKIVEENSPQQKDRNIKTLKRALCNNFIVRIEDIPDNYWQSRMHRIRNRGESGDWQNLSIPEQHKIKQDHLNQLREDQKGSLEEWVDYLTSEKSSYLPTHLKYWTLRSVLKLERYENGSKDKDVPGRFPERSTGRQRSIKTFPEVNDRALKFIAEAYNANLNKQKIKFRYDIPKSAQNRFESALKSRDFRALYTWGQEYLPPISDAEMETTAGIWVTYSKKTDANRLTEALRGKGSGWCIAGEETAKEYLSTRDLTVYYTYDQQGTPTIPRIVIVTKNDKVLEVRGVGWEENVDAKIQSTNIIQDKLQKLPGGNEFTSTNKDMQFLTSIDQKMRTSQPLTKEELFFLYEIDKPIEYFGVEKDPRIMELRAKRDTAKDVPIIFDCLDTEIAHNPDSLNPNTKVYIGPITRKLFESPYKNTLDQMYITFPEGKIETETVKATGQTMDRIIEDLHKKKVFFVPPSIEMLNQLDLKTGNNQQTINLVTLRIKDLGIFSEYFSIEEVYDRAMKLGLELCPAEVAPYWLLQRPLNSPTNAMSIAMKPISDWKSHCSVFFVANNYSSRLLVLGLTPVGEKRNYNTEEKLAFCLPSK